MKMKRITEDANKILRDYARTHGITMDMALERTIKSLGRPSDLEIVQKALEKELMNVNIYFNGDWILYKGSQEVNGGHDLDFLVAWAKQQLGE